MTFGRLERRPSPQPMSEINMTPLVDVMLVLVVDDLPMDQAALSATLRQAAQRYPDTEVRLRADAQVPYGRVVEVMGLAHQAGLHRIGFVAQTAAATH